MQRVFVVIAVGAWACARPAPGEPGEPDVRSDVQYKDFPQRSQPTLDVLWVVDASPAMQAQRAMVQAGVHDAMAKLDVSVEDLAIAAVTADGTPRGEVRSQGLPDVVVTTDVADEVVPLADVAPATTGANTALAAAATASAHAWRADAEHAIVFVLASDDASPGAPSDYDLGSGTRVFAVIAGDAPRMALVATSGVVPLADGFASALPFDQFVKTTLGLPCIDVPTTTCAVEEDAPGGAGEVFSACATGELPCWKLVPNAECGGGQFAIDYANLRVTRAPRMIVARPFSGTHAFADFLVPSASSTWIAPRNRMTKSHPSVCRNRYNF